MKDLNAGRCSPGIALKRHSNSSVALNYNHLLAEWERETARLSLIHLKRWRIAGYSWVRYLTDISTGIKD